MDSRLAGTGPALATLRRAEQDRPMTLARLAALALILLPLRALALGPEDCERWIGQLRDQAATAIPADDEREGLLKHLGDASLQQKGATPADSAKRIDEFQRKAARLKAAGKVSDWDGQRLQNISEAARRCVTQLERQGRE